jgi:DNA-binding transcriptional MerR regulator
VAASLRYTDLMSYTKQDLIEQSGLPDRTIRNYLARGLIPRPRGHGLAAEYDEEHLVRAVAIGRMRGQGMHIDAITERIADWTTAKFKRFVAKTEPPAEPAPSPPSAPSAPPPPPPPPEEPHPLLGEVVPRARLRGRDAHREIEETDDDDALPQAPSWRIFSLVTGLGLMVDVDAPPVVHRIALENPRQVRADASAVAWQMRARGFATATYPLFGEAVGGSGEHAANPGFVLWGAREERGGAAAEVWSDLGDKQERGLG